MDKKHCVGCRDNFYNGNNELGITECWSLKTATLVKKKRVDINQRPPWNQKAETIPSCHRAEGYVFVGENQTC